MRRTAWVFRVTAVLGTLAIAGCGGRVGDRAPGADGSGGSGGSNAGASDAGATATASAGARSTMHPNSAGYAGSGGAGATGGMQGMSPPDGPDSAPLPTGDSGVPGSTTTLSTATRQVWVGELTRWVTYPDVPDPNGTPEHVVLVLSADGADDTGSIVLGNAAPPPPVSDATAFYPPLGGIGQELAARLSASPLEGAPYALLAVWKTDTRLSFQIQPQELWSAWCAKQTSCPPSSNCTPSSGQLAVNGVVCTANAPDLSPHPPTWEDLCGPTGTSVCICKQTTCQWNSTDSSRSWSFDLELKNSLLDGQLSFGKYSPSGFWILGVRLRRVE